MNMAIEIIRLLRNDLCERIQIEQEIVPPEVTEAASKTPPDGQREIITSPQTTSRM
jgi:hypothetical protein